MFLLLLVISMIFFIQKHILFFGVFLLPRRIGGGNTSNECSLPINLEEEYEQGACGVCVGLLLA